MCTNFIRHWRQKIFPMCATALVLSIANVAPPASAAMQFFHPGGVNGKIELDLVRDRIRADPQRWSATGQYAALREWATNYTKTQAPSAHKSDSGAAKEDAKKAYANALAWYYTGEAQYATHAIAIFSVWSDSFEGYTVQPGVSSQSQLEAAWIGALMGSAAEILRAYPGWTPKQQTALKALFANKFYPALGQKSDWNGNVDLTQIDALMSLAVFNENEAWYQLAKSRLQQRNPNYFYLPSDTGIDYSGTNPSWYSPSLWVAGLSQETCRTNPRPPNDNGHHAQYAMASALRASEVAWNQGDSSIYDDNQPRYLAVMELLAKQINSGDMQGVCHDPVSTKNLFDTWEIGYRHYHGRRGLSLPHTATLIANATKRSKISDWNIFFESLTHGGLPTIPAQ